MPFTRPALTVGPGAHAAPEARRWMREALDEVGRLDLRDCAELVISELVANAFLHGSAPITIKMRGSVSHPLVEVEDASTTVPVLPSTSSPDVFATDAFATEGRGLQIVARACVHWGIRLKDDGKVVWFEPSTELSDEATDAHVTDRRTPTS